MAYANNYNSEILKKLFKVVFATKSTYRTIKDSTTPEIKHTSRAGHNIPEAQIYRSTDVITHGISTSVLRTESYSQ